MVRGAFRCGHAAVWDTLRSDSWRASFRFRACIGTMNWFVLVLVVGLVLEIAETGSNVEDENEDEEEWVGSWKASFRFCACIGTMNLHALGVPASAGSDGSC